MPVCEEITRIEFQWGWVTAISQTMESKKTIHQTFQCSKTCHLVCEIQ
jgi:hypothetical protein